MPLFVRDSLTRTDRPVVATGRRPLTMYVCGPTVYDSAHVGHGRTYLYFDIARRWLEVAGTRVRHVMNITDFEDKITARAAALGIGWRTLAQHEERSFARDLGAFGLLWPHETPRASDFLRPMAAIGRRLESKGLIERRDDEWFYRPRGDPPSPNFAVGGALAQHAVPEPGHPFPASNGADAEFLVWKRQEPPAPAWDGPWGRGMPGWHLECFAMAEKYLGLPVDLHGGGLDLVYPHHFAENELALSLHRTPFARVFLHTAFVTENGRKMSKSVGNLVPLRLAIEDVGADALKWYLLTTPYHQRLAWNPKELETSRTEFDLVRHRLCEALEAGGGGSLPLSTVEAAVDGLTSDIGDGFRVHDALDRLRTLAHHVGRSPMNRVGRGDRPAARRAIARAERTLGISLVPPAARGARARSGRRSG